METFSALLALCAGNSPVIGEFPTQRPVTRSFHNGECNDRDGVSNHQHHDCFLNRLFRHTSKHRVTDLCAWNSPVTGEFPAQRASNAENVSIWWRHHIDVFFDLRLNNDLANHTDADHLRHHCAYYDFTVMAHVTVIHFFQDSKDREDQLGPVETADIQVPQVGNDNEHDDVIKFDDAIVTIPLPRLPTPCTPSQDKDGLSMYRNFHYKSKTVVRPSYFIMVITILVRRHLCIGLFLWLLASPCYQPP